jgi:hypothetical protein
MNFFFEYIFFRITELTLKRTGRTGAIAIVFISLMQLFIIEAIADPISKYFLNKKQLTLYTKPFAWLGVAIYVLFFFLNYKRFNGMYNKYRFHWKDETTNQRLIRGILVFISLIFPFALFVLLNVRWT